MTVEFVLLGKSGTAMVVSPSFWPRLHEAYFFLLIHGGFADNKPLVSNERATEKEFI